MPASRRRGVRPRPEPGGPKEAIVSARSSPHSGERRTTMRHSVVGIVFAVATALMWLPAQAQTWTVPSEGQRCPSKWGAGDERGSGNHMKPASVLRATQLIKTGEVIEIAHVLNDKMVINPGRKFDVTVKRTFMNDFSNRRGSNEELVVSEIGQVGTQFDGFAHQSHEDSHYNCFKTGAIATRTGFTKLGIEKVGMLMTRGVLIDVAALKGVPMLGDTYEITVEDLDGAIKKQNLTFQPGDAIIIHTGWGKLWNTEPARYAKGNPGIGVKAAEFLLAKDPILLGADTAPVEVNPNPDKLISLPLHQMAPSRIGSFA